MKLRTIVALGAVLVGCTAPGTTPTSVAPPTTDPPPSTTATTMTTSTSTTTSTVAPPTTVTPTTTTQSPVSDEPGPHGVAVYLPDDPAGAPVAVLVHGGGWVAGHPDSIAPLGRALADRGFVVFNASYRTALVAGAFPGMFDDVACAVRFARTRAGELGASDQVALIGHSAGAHLGAVVAFTADAFGEGCPWEGSSIPDQFVSLAGLFRLDSVAPLMEALLGGDRATVPDAWDSVDPFEHLAAATGVAVTLVHGDADRIVPPVSSVELGDAIEEAGGRVVVEILEGADHMSVIDPATVADLITNLTR